MTSLFSTNIVTTVENIQWDKGPADATHYLPDSEENHELFLKLEGRTVQYVYAQSIAAGDSEWSDKLVNPPSLDEILAEPTLTAKPV